MGIWPSLRSVQPASPSDPSARRRRQTAQSRLRELRLEKFEERQLLAISPHLVAIIPNEGELLFDGDVRDVAPRELTFRFDEGQVIDPASVGAIRLQRAGNDGQFGTGDDVLVVPGWVGVGQIPNDVVVRFAETLPDDSYRITIVGAGENALMNVDGDPFNDGEDLQVDFDLELGAQVRAVVPQPIHRGAGGELVQENDKIVVYFNDDDLDSEAAENPNFYQLIFTGKTASNGDDVVYLPTTVVYDAATDTAVLTFASPLEQLASGPGVYRLRIGNDDPLPLAPIHITPSDDPGSTFNTAFGVGTLDGASRIVSAEIVGRPYPLLFPGGSHEPGHRDIPAESHLHAGGNLSGEIAVIPYNFNLTYGSDPPGVQLPNLITETQKQRAREIFEIYSRYLGVQFIETESSGFTIVTGDPRVLSPNVPTGPGGVGGIAGGGLAIMDSAEDWGESEFGGGWFQVAMHEIGHLLGLGHSYDLPPLTIQGSEGEIAAGTNVEPVFPGDHDIVHGRHLWPNFGRDIDVYEFALAESGRFRAEIIAERLPSASFLDSLITLYDADGNIIARNDKYFSRDSFLDLRLEAGSYYIAVTASGNAAFDPRIEDSGIGGTSQGVYQLRLDFHSGPGASMVDVAGTALDGDADGRPGGEFNFWLHVEDASRTIYVDKAAPGGSTADGSLANPYNNIATAIAAVEGHKSSNPDWTGIIRIVGNGGLDGDIDTIEDNLAYEIGFDVFGNPLADGPTLDVPQGVTLMIDAGALLKLRRANINAGSFEHNIDYSHSAIQVLGTPERSVFFTSYHDEARGFDTNPLQTTPAPSDWGGIVLRSDSDYEQAGIFLNFINHADIRYGGGSVLINGQEIPFSPIWLDAARPTVSYNIVTLNGDAAMSATPDSFEENRFHGDDYTADYLRIGPHIRGNTVVENSINGLLIRVETHPGSNIETMRVAGRFDDTDIVHVVPEKLTIEGQAGGPQFNGQTGVIEARLDGRLVVDPRVVVKLQGSRIETYMGGYLIAEADARNPVVFTSLADDRFGAGGAFDTNADAGAQQPAPGDWGGIYFGHATSGSLDHVLLTFAGGVTKIEGNFDRFNPIEVHQADVRITNSILERNQSGLASSNRHGRGSNAQASIFVRGAQPIIINNIIRDSFGDAININANALNWFSVVDTGRSRGLNDAFTQFVDNQGPLVRLNRLANNKINGMVVRGSTLTTQSVWDDTDIVHVLLDEIVVPNHHTYSGLRLQSTSVESLVVKLQGANAGITASGTPLDIDDRIGGTVIVVGNAVRPVIMTSLRDDSVGAGLDPHGQPQRNTNNLASTPAPGDWRSIKIDTYSNDRNVGLAREFETPLRTTGDLNATPHRAQYLGLLAPNEKSGDPYRRLGFEVHGYLDAGDVDVYSFEAEAGTEVWFDLDRTRHALDTVLELVDANGNVLARSINSTDETADPELYEHGLERSMRRGAFGFGDLYTTNPRDAGVRIVLPGNTGTVRRYYVRVRSNSDDLSDLQAGVTTGSYQLQIRLREVDEFPGSTVRHANIRYANDGVEVIGKPTNSPLLGESFESETQASLISSDLAAVFSNDDFLLAQDLGNLLEANRNTISVGGAINQPLDVDWYKFTLDYQSIQAIGGLSTGGKTWATLFDIDYADGMARPDTIISVFDEFGNLVLVGRESDISDDRSATSEDLRRGSFGALDPFIGSVHLPEGEDRTYYVAIHSNATLPTALQGTFSNEAANKLVRLEPIHGVRRIVEDHIGFAGYRSGTDLVGHTHVEPEQGAILPIDDLVHLQTQVRPFTLSDVSLFVSQGFDTARLVTVDPYTGALEMVVGGLADGPNRIKDIVIRSDGQMFGYLQQQREGEVENSAGALVQIDPATGDIYIIGRDNIPDDGDDEDPDDFNTLSTFNIDALTYRRLLGANGAGDTRYRLLYSVNAGGNVSRLFSADPWDGDATVKDDRPGGALGDIVAEQALNVVVEISPEDPAGRIVLESDGDGATVGRIRREGNTLRSVFVDLFSSRPDVADWAVSTIEIPAGEAFVDVDINVFDNALMHGNRAVEFWAEPVFLTPFNLSYDSISDNLEVLDDELIDATVSINLNPPFVIEDHPNFGTATGTVVLSSVTTRDLIVTLHSADTSRITVPATVTIPAGSSSVPFTITSVSDPIADHSQLPPTVGITAVVPEVGFGNNNVVFIDSAGIIPVTPDPVTLTIDPSMVEGITATLDATREDTVGQLVVQLVSSSPDVVFSRPLLIFQDGDDAPLGGPVTVTALNNDLAFGDFFVEIEAIDTATSTQVGSTSVVVLDDEPELTLTLNATSIPEVGGSTFGTVTRNTPTTNDLVVTLVNHDPSEILIPDSVIIPAGSTSATFPIEALDDQLSDPSQRAFITAAADGWQSGRNSVLVTSSTTPLGLTTGMSYLQFQGVLLFVPSAGQTMDGHTFTVSDAFQTVTFEFDTGNGVAAGNVPVPFDPTWTNIEMRDSIRDAIDNSVLNVEPSSLNDGSLILLGAFGSGVGNSFVQFSNLPNSGFQLFGVSNQGYFYRINDLNGQSEIVSRIPGNPTFAGLAPAPPNLDLNGDGVRGDLQFTLFAITTNGFLYAIDAIGTDGRQAGDLRDDVFPNGALFLDTGLNDVTGLSFGPLDFNLWHPTLTQAGDTFTEPDQGRGINPAFDFSRTGDFEHSYEDVSVPEALGGASFHFGLEVFGGGYIPYPNLSTYGALSQDTQYGLLFEQQQRDLTEFATALAAGGAGAARFNDLHPDLREQTAIGNNYNVPGGAHGSLITQPFSLASYTSTDKPTLYFNYYLETENANSSGSGMRDAARVFASVDGGQTWQMLATNNSVLDAELPEYISANGNVGNFHPDQHVQELFDTVRDSETGEISNVWRQARIDLGQFAGESDIILRFDFSTAGTIADPSHPVHSAPMPGDQFGDFKSAGRGQNNNHRGFFIDDIIVGFAERGEMVTRPASQLDPNNPNAPGPDTSFFPVPQDPSFTAPSENLVGAYQLEIRRGFETQVIATQRTPWTFQVTQYDTNDRLIQGFSIDAPAGLYAPDGQLFIIDDGVNAITFELERAPEMVFANGNRFFDGDTFVLSGQTFEFDTNGSVASGHVAIPIERFQSSGSPTVADDIAQAAFQAINGAGLGLTVTIDGNRLFLLNSANESATIPFTPIQDSLAIVFDGFSGTQPGHVPVIFRGTDTEAQIAARLGAAINSQDFGVSASVRPTSSRVDLTDAVDVKIELVQIDIEAAQTALQDYVDDDSDFGGWELNNQFSIIHPDSGEAFAVYVLDVHSQTWRSAADLDHFEWRNWVSIIVPADISPDHDTATLFIEGGSNTMNPPDSQDDIDDEIVDLLPNLSTILVVLPNVPNQPLTFTGDPNNSRAEDGAIAYTFYQFWNDTDDVTWPLLLPMVKTAVRTMDSVQEFLASDQATTQYDIDSFLVTGGSKRGWTTYLTAAVDPRVKGILPMVFDALNLDEQMVHHRLFFEDSVDLGEYFDISKSFVGNHSIAIQDYVQIGAMTRLFDAAGQALLKIVDPYEHRDKLTMPKLLVHAAGDEFFVPNSSQFYFDDLPGQNYLMYVPNAGHGDFVLSDMFQEGYSAFHRALLNDLPLPEFSWSVTGDYTIEVDVDDPTLLEVNFWQTTDPNNLNLALFLEGEEVTDFRWFAGNNPFPWESRPLEANSEGVYVGTATPPLFGIGKTAFMIELIFDSGGPDPYRFTTEVVVSPTYDRPRTAFEVVQFDRRGDENLFRDQGQTIIEANTILNSQRSGVRVDAGERVADLSFPGGVRNLRELNYDQLVPGVTVQNNVVARSGESGIHFSGGAQQVDVPDPNDPEQTITVPELPLAAVPFGRIVNNTIYGGGQGAGIVVTGSASPTLLNNIVAGLQAGVVVTSDSSSAVIGGTVYQNNLVNSQSGNLGSFPLVLDPAAPLFANATADNFYLAADSRAIDSSINSLQERPEMAKVTNPLGIPSSPILAPATDLYGQLRLDDPSTPSLPGIGSNVFKDRGAIDRVDFIGPAASLALPADNDPSDLDPTATHVTLDSAVLRHFMIHLTDSEQVPGEPFGGSGIDALTVTSDRFVVRRGSELLEEGVDYFFSYDENARMVVLTPVEGIWLGSAIYTIDVDNSPTGVLDLAGNPLKPNRLTGDTRFTIVMQPLPPTHDFGDAPSPYPTLLTDDGARHLVVDGYYLGSGVTATDDGEPHPTAHAGLDDGVTFDTPMVPGSVTTITVTASGEGLLHAWIDFNGDGDWNDPGEQIFANEPLVEGENELTFAVPSNVSPTSTFARFRFSTDTNLAPTGDASDGEVEDYQVEVSGVVAYTIVLTDASGTELTKDLDGRYLVRPGETVIAEVYVQDQRTVGASGGVFSAYADLLSSNGVLVFNAGSFEIGGSFPNVQSGTVDNVNHLIDEAGGTATAGAPTGSLQPQLLFRVSGTMDLGAQLDHEISLVLDESDNPLFSTSVFGLDDPVSASYGSVTLVVHTPGWQNPVNSLDVNNDGFVTPLDALIILNELNAPPPRGPRVLPSPPTPPDPVFYFDVNGDGAITALDALIVINYLNSLSSSSSMGSSSAMTGTVVESAPVQGDAAAPSAKATITSLDGGEAPTSVKDTYLVEAEPESLQTAAAESLNEAEFVGTAALALQAEKVSSQVLAQASIPVAELGGTLTLRDSVLPAAVAPQGMGPVEVLQSQWEDGDDLPVALALADDDAEGLLAEALLDSAPVAGSRDLDQRALRLALAWRELEEEAHEDDWAWAQGE